jgi:methionyl-tRNA formyltransferase
MNLLFVIEETNNFHADFLKKFLQQTLYEISGIILVTRISQKYNTDYYFKQNIRYLTLKEKYFLLIRNNWLQKKNNMYLSSSFDNLVSVRAVINFFKLDYCEVEDSVNKDYILKWIKTKNPDVIISCGQAIFGKELLKTPKICCINRHSSLLPSYKGVLPVFHAYRNGEAFSGASIHTMEQKLDEGIVLSQEQVPIVKGESMFSIYKKTFNASIPALIQALKKLEQGDFSEITNLSKHSYFSFPTKEQWQEFRCRGGRII